MWGRKRFPDMPLGVRIEKIDGSVVPLEMVYEGKRRGRHCWTSVINVEFNVGDQFAFDYMPARTELSFAFKSRMVWEDEDK